MTAGRALGRAALLLAAGAPRAAQALDPTRRPALYQRQRWGAEEGFPGDGVHAITQGSDGYLWIASERGLVRFDGTEFRLVAGRGRRGVRRRPDMLGIVRDAPGTSGCAPIGPTCCAIATAASRASLSPPDPREVAVTAMTLGRGGELLLYAQLSGLLARRGERFERLPLEPLPTSLVFSMAETPDGTLFLGTRDSGLFQVRDGRLAPLWRGCRTARSTACSRSETRGVGRHRPRHRALERQRAHARTGCRSALRGVQALALVRDRDANVWVGTSDGLLRANAHGAAALEARPPARGAVTALFEDREGDLWLGGGSGIERLHDTPFTTYARAHGLPSDGGGAVHVDRGDRVWFAPAEGGLYGLEDERVERIAIVGVETDRVYSIAGGPRRPLDRPPARRADPPSLRGADASRTQLHRGRRAQPTRASTRCTRAATGACGRARSTAGSAACARVASRPSRPRTACPPTASTRSSRAATARCGWARPPGLAAWSLGAWTTRRVRGRPAVRQRERARRGLAGRAVDRHVRRPRVPALRDASRCRAARRRRCARRSSAWPRARAAGSGSPPRAA